MTKQTIRCAIYEGGTSAISAMTQYIMQELATPLANAIGYVVRTDLTVEEPTYAPYSTVVFLAPASQTETPNDPDICIYSNNHSSSRYTICLFGSCNYVNGVWRPTFVPGSVSMSNNGTISRYDSNFAMYVTNSTYPPVFDIYSLSNGRKFISLTGDSAKNKGSFFMTNIYADGVNVGKKIVFLVGAYSTSYIDALQSTSYGTDTTATLTINRPQGGVVSGGGFINDTQEFVISPSYLNIGRQVKIDGCAWFSNKSKALIGSCVNINGTQYIIIWLYNVGNDSNCALITPI